MQEEPMKSMQQVIIDDGRYPPEAFAFLHEGLNRAVQEVYRGQAGSEGQHHVSGQQLCRALRDLAIERWGLMAQAVLAKWNVRRTIDFGNMVYLLIENQYMRKTDEDSLEHFRGVYDFDKAFGSYEAFELKE